MGPKLLSLAGLAVLLGLAWAASERRQAVRWRPVLWGLGLQFLVALTVLATPLGRPVFQAANRLFDALLRFSNQGSGFLFGSLVTDYKTGAIVAFQVLPIIIVVSALAALLDHFGVIAAVVNGFAWLMHRTMRVSGVEAFLSALQVFSGIEGVTAARAYVERLTRSELFAVMVGFMGTIASSVMVAYASFGAEPGHLMAASVMSAPGALVIAKLMVPETGLPETAGVRFTPPPRPDGHAMDAVITGALDGLKLAAQIGALLIAFIALIHLFNAVLGRLGLSFEGVVGWVMTPVAWLLGVPWGEAGLVGQLLGTKTVFNEFLAYVKLQELVQAHALSPRAVMISTYALCGFANFGSLAILLGALGGLAPGRRAEASSLAFRSLLAGTLTSLVTAGIAGLFA